MTEVVIYVCVVKTDAQIQSDCPITYFRRLDEHAL